MSFRSIPLPIYHTLSGLQGILDATMLRSGVTNNAGQVDSNGNLLFVRGILPGPLRDFPDVGTITDAKVKLVSMNGINVLDLDGNRWLRSNLAASTWDFFSHNATFANMRWTVTMMCRPGYGDVMGVAFGFLGTNGTSSGAKGFCIFMDDRVGLSQTKVLGHQITKGTAGAISTSTDNNQITLNGWDIYRFTFDGSQTAANRFKAYKNKVQLTTTVTSSSTATVTTPTNTLEIGNVGGGLNTFGFIGQISHVILQNVVESTATADAFEDSLQPWRTALNNHQHPQCSPYNFLTGDLTRYYIGVVMVQDPTSPNIITRTYREGTSHLLDGTSEIKNSISTDYGVTWGTPTVVFTTGGASGLNMGGFTGGYDATGRLWMIGEKRTVGGTNTLPFELWRFYSDDNGATWTFTDITSATVPADGLDSYSPIGHMIITSTGRMMIPMYKWTGGGTTNSAIYALYSDDDGATWGTKTIRAAAAGYQTETDFVICGDRIIAYSRDEATKFFHVWYSDNDGDTWVDDGGEDLGEGTWTSAAPPIFSQFNLYGVSVTAIWFSDRNFGADPYYFYGLFARTSTLESDPHGWDLDTKVMFRPRVVHYGMIVHPFNDFHAIGSFAEEPITSPFLNDNRMITFYIGDDKKSLIAKQLGITPI